MNKKSVASNTIFNTLKSLMTILYPLITFPYISRVLLTDNVGKVNFGNSVVSYISLMASLGITSYAMREVAKVREERALLDRTASEIFSINIVSTLIAYIVLAFLLVFSVKLSNYRLLIVIQSSAILFATLGADWLNTAMEDFKYLAIRTVLSQVFALVAMFVFVHKPEDYMVYALICVAASSGANVLNIFYRKRFCHVRFTFDMNLKKHMLPIMLLFSMALSQTIYCNSDMTMLGIIKGDYEVGLYSTAVKVYNIVNTVVASVAYVVIPQLSVAFSKRDRAEIDSLARYSLNYILVLGLPCITGIAMITRPIIVLAAGAEYLGAVLPLRILMISLLMSFVSGWMGNIMLIPSGNERICLWASVISAIVNFGLNLFLLPRYGAAAAAATTAAAELVGIVVKIPVMKKEKLFIGNVLKMILAPILGCLAIVLVCGILSICFTDILFAVISIPLSIVFYGLILLAMKNEIAVMLMNILKRRFVGPGH